MKIKLKTLVITFDDNATSEDVASVSDLLLHYKGQAIFIVREDKTVVKVPGKGEAKHGKKG